jgi:Fe-S cluster biogenesis protein NfuA
VALADEVTAVLQASVLPSVIARGGAIRVLAVENGVATLEISGSPGAALPLLTRIESVVRRGLPAITTVRMVGPASRLAESEAGDDPTALARDVLDREVNPVVAAHRGHVSLVAVEGGWVRVRLEGGCQGCSLAEVTLRQGIEPLLRAKLAGFVGLVDVTDHQAGREPFYSPGKR